MVQTILNGTFRQRVHGPPAGKRPFMPPPPPGPHRAWFTVNGAGTALAWESLALGEWTHVRLTAAAPFQDDINLFSRVTDNDPRCV